MSTNMNRFLVVDDLPPGITAAKQGTFLKLFQSKLPDIIGHDPVSVELVGDAKDESFTSAFIEMKTAAQADTAVEKLNGFAFTKACKFSAFAWSEFDTVLQTSDTDKKHKASASSAKSGDDDANAEDGSAADAVRDMTNSFLIDDKVRPQLIIKSGRELDVTYSFLNTTGVPARLDQIRTTKNNFEKCPWAEVDKTKGKLQKPLPGQKPFPMWTPKGTYLVSQHPDELKFWGGVSMQCCAQVKVPIQHFQELTISSTETFCIVKARGDVYFWNIVEGRMIRKFDSARAALAGAAGATGDAAANNAAADEENTSYQYNADDTIVGSLVRTAAKQGISMYDAKSMKLIVAADSQSRFTQEIPDVQSFSFNPANPKMYAYVVREPKLGGVTGTEDDIQAPSTWRIHIDAVAVSAELAPAFTSLCRRQWTNLLNINILWHPNGEFLAAKLTKSQPNGKQYVDYCIFRTASNTVSAELFDPQGEARRFVFQPSASRFALLVVPSKQTSLMKRQYLQFFHVEKGSGVKKVSEFECEASKVVFAPKGSRCVAVDLEKSNIEFFGCLGSGPFAPTLATQKVEHITEKNSDNGVPNVHKLPTEIEWDPTGRFLAVVTSALQVEAEANQQLTIWNANGRIIMHEKMSKLSHATFRPFPKSLLTEQQLTAVKNSLPKKTVEYDAILQQEKDKIAAEEQRKLTVVEDRYRKALRDVNEDAEKAGYTATRKELIESAPMYKYLLKQAAEAK